MHHCVAGYDEYVADGKSYIYHVEMDDGEVGTLEIGHNEIYNHEQRTYDRMKNWSFRQLRGHCNKDVSPEMYEAVETWLERFPIGGKAIEIKSW
jgi:hypothetical protein